MRWFPLQARVTPGPGGAMRWTWGDMWTWDTCIESWDPPRRVRLIDEMARPFDVNGRPAPPGSVEPARIAIEFTLEA